MKPSELVPAINATICHLEWLNADRYTGALRLVAAVPVDHDNDSGGSGGDAETRDRRAIGGHSDPTGDAVCSSADRQAKLADRAEIVCDTAAWLRGTVGHARPTNGARGLLGASGDLLWCITIPHSIAAWKAPSEEARNEVHHAVQLCHDETSTLRYEVEQALRYSATVAAGRPKPRPLRYCRCCEPWGYHEPALPTSDLCEVCKTFRDEHKCWPTKSIRDDRAMGRKRVRPGQLAEAKAARRATVKARRTA